MTNGYTMAQARIDLTAALRWAVRLGLNEGICNHFSLQAPGLPDCFLVNPHGLHWSELTPNDLVLVDEDGQVIQGRYNVEATALHIHGRLHVGKPNATCVLHTHMPYATALALTDGGRLEWAVYADAGRWTYEPWSDPTAWDAGVRSKSSAAPTASGLIAYWARLAGRSFGIWLLPLILGISTTL